MCSLCQQTEPKTYSIWAYCLKLLYRRRLSLLGKLWLLLFQTLHFDRLPCPLFYCCWGQKNLLASFLSFDSWSTEQPLGTCSLKKPKRNWSIVKKLWFHPHKPWELQLLLLLIFLMVTKRHLSPPQKSFLCTCEFMKLSFSLRVIGRLKFHHLLFPRSTITVIWLFPQFINTQLLSVILEAPETLLHGIFIQCMLCLHTFLTVEVITIFLSSAVDC